MSESKTSIEAKKHLLHATKGKIGGADSLVKNGKLNINQHTSKTIDHMGVANEMVKIITKTPGLPVKCRQVMCYRILNPGITDMGIALSMAMRVDEVRKYENEGRNHVIEHMKSTDINYNIEKFNADRIIQNELMNMNKQGKSNPLLAADKKGF